MGLTEGSETSAIINQTPGNYPKESLPYTVHGESLKSRIFYITLPIFRNNIANESFLQPDHIFPGQNFFYGESGNRIEVTDT